MYMYVWETKGGRGKQGGGGKDIHVHIEEGCGEARRERGSEFRWKKSTKNIYMHGKYVYSTLALGKENSERRDSLKKGERSSMLLCTCIII